MAKSLTTTPEDLAVDANSKTTTMDENNSNVDTLVERNFLNGANNNDNPPERDNPPADSSSIENPTMLSDKLEKQQSAAAAEGKIATIPEAIIHESAETSVPPAVECPEKEPTSSGTTKIVTLSVEEDSKEKENMRRGRPPNAVVPASSSSSSGKIIKEEGARKPDLVTLPMDSLHHMASFLLPSEFKKFAQSSKASNNVFREIIRRVRLHGFKCATEVITAWKLGHHSDAKELAALYIHSGIPIYPRSLGHSYQTIIWKMQVESREIFSQQQQQNNSTNNSNSKVDEFYTERADFRNEKDYAPELTYVEEKCFYLTTKAIDSGRAKSPPRVRRSLIRQNANDNSNNNSNANTTAGTARPVSPAHSDTESVVVDRIPVRVHQHLVDQHTRRKFCINDNDGLMVTPGISLSADFYHPSNSDRNNDNGGNAAIFEGTMIDLHSIPENIESNQIDDGDGDGDDIEHPQEFNVVEPVDVADADDLLIAQDGTLTVSERRRPPSPDKLCQALQSCEVEAYSASLETSLTSDDVDGSHELRKLLRSRFAVYQRRLETCLAHTDNSGFEECILDFWDEFFPQTAYIQYYDLHTAVPRVSCLHKFLTRPCPKAIGIVQCEIERIKVTSRGKGVSMKGRLFPTYEYRLFIRHRPHNQSPESALAGEDDDGFDRRDTVLMVAKNRGRKHTEITGVGHSKKGSNNYYLYMPQQMDVDAHYNKFNNLPEPSKMNPNGASLDPVIVSEESSSVLMGRLQSNFIGTEFQIFTPRQNKQQRRKGDPQVAKTVYSPSDDEVDYDSGVSSDTNSTRRSRPSRFRLGPAQDGSESSADMTTRTRARSLPRSMSTSDTTRRPNRRAIANAEGVTSQTNNVTEEEDGVITYTANLLGSRPRIMDVCIPRVAPDGVAGTEWRRYIESNEEPEDGRMLGCFRQLLQRLENLDPQQPRLDGGLGAQEPHHGDDADPAPSNGDDFGLVPLQNRPPWWNVELGSFVLNFGGRVSVASVKNFQLCDRNDQDNIMLQFGRIHGRHSFTMDFQYPLTAVQAFSIAISSLQSKISFG